MAKRKVDKTIYLLIGIILVLAAALLYTYFYQPTATQLPKVTNPQEAIKIQTNITEDIREIKSILERLNKTLG